MQDIEHIRAALEELNPTCFHLLYAFWVEGKSHKTIAKELGRSESEIIRRHKICREELRNLIHGNESRNQK